MAKKSKKTCPPPPSFESARLVEAQFAADGLNARSSTSHPVTGVEDMASTSTDRTVQAHLQPNFVSTEESRECAAAVRESLSLVSATADTELNDSRCRERCPTSAQGQQTTSREVGKAEQEESAQEHF